MKRTTMKGPEPAVGKVMKRLHYPFEVILVCVRWYVAFPLSLRNLATRLTLCYEPDGTRLCPALL
jgi:hypothetical protein